MKACFAYQREQVGVKFVAYSNNKVWHLRLNPKYDML